VVGAMLLAPFLVRAQTPSHAPHVIVSYDVSGSMSPRYMGDAMAGTLQSIVQSVLFDTSGPRVPAGATEYRRDDFRGFPFIGPESKLSLFRFGNSVYKGAERQNATPDVLREFFPDSFPDNNTAIEAAIQHSATVLFNPDLEEFAYWIFVSDAQDDPSNPALYPAISQVRMKRDVVPVYSVTIPTPYDLSASLVSKWKAGDPQLNAAFGSAGPPTQAAVQVFKISEAGGLRPPKQVTYELTNENNVSSVRIQWYPGEWDVPQAAAGPVMNEQAETYRVERSVDKLNWEPLGAPASRTGIYPYVIESTTIPEGRQFLRVLAQRGQRSMASDWIVVNNVPPPSVPITDVSRQNGLTRISWSVPDDDDISLTIEMMDESGNWVIVPGSEQLDPKKGYWQSADIPAGRQLRVVAHRKGWKEKAGPPTKDPGVPEAPAFGEVTACFDAVTQSTRINWTAPSDNDVTVAIERSDDGGKTWVLADGMGAVPAAPKEVTARSIVAGDRIRLKAAGAGREGLPSAEVTVQACADSTATEAPAKSQPASAKQTGGPGPEFIVAFVVLLAVVALIAYLLYKMFFPAPLGVELAFADGIGTRFECSLERKQRIVLAAGRGEDNDIVWPEPDAPRFYFRRHGNAVNLFEIDESGDETNEMDRGVAVEGEPLSMRNGRGEEVALIVTYKPVGPAREENYQTTGRNTDGDD
jgi:hypothetical protein